ncbi:MAG TPA: TolC family protein [Acidobacteriaceae bacterium]|jgi:outer membrane protein TolC|nr:TolC family protein [Acidobacteriaceae bacterium]
MQFFNKKRMDFLRQTVAALIVSVTVAGTVTAQTVAQTANAGGQVYLGIPHSHVPWKAYMPSSVPRPDLANSSRLDTLIRDGKLYLSLQDAITLALENNLDLEIARYNFPIAATDVQRTEAGGIFRGVNTGVVSNTPGGGVGGIGAGASGAGAGGTSGGAGGAGAGASGIVSNTLGTGTAVQTFDPTIQGVASVEHQTSPVTNNQVYGVAALQVNTTIGNASYLQAFPTGTSIEFDFQNNRQTINSPYYNLTPQLSSSYRFEIQQQLLAGFGFGPNLRYLRIARNNQKISDIAFKAQVIATVTQIENLYWDLFNAYQDEQVKERSLQFAQQSYDNTQKQLNLQAVPEMDVLKAEAEVANRTQDVTIAKTTLQLQELLMKNAITKNLNDPILVAMPVIPTEKMNFNDAAGQTSIADMVATALTDRSELEESQIDLVNRQISRRSAKNALLPTVNLVASYTGYGLAGVPNPAYNLGPNPSSVPTSFTGAVQNAFNFSSPDYLAELQISIPIRNRIAKADQYRSELEYRQAQIRQQELRNQIRIEVQNADYTLEQSRARVDSAQKARDLAQKTFGIMQQEQKLGAGSNTQTLSAQHDLAVAESALVTAMTAYQKARVQLDSAIGTTLERNHISIAEAISGVVHDNH